MFGAQGSLNPLFPAAMPPRKGTIKAQDGPSSAGESMRAQTSNSGASPFNNPLTTGRTDLQDANYGAEYGEEDEEEEEEYDDDEEDDEDEDEDDDAEESDQAKSKTAFDEKFFSIVDFDFGEDDDDPDFVPENMNLNFGTTQDFAEALANVAHNNSNINAEASSSQHALRHGMEQQQPSSDTMWQQMFASLGPGPQPPMASGNAPLLESPNSNARRLRSSSKNGEASNMHDMMPNMNPYGQQVPMSAASMPHREESTATSDRVLQDDEGSMDGSSSAIGKAKRNRRRIYTQEEAIERRRQANRECARRQRQKKREEEERVRLELERLGSADGKATAEGIAGITQSLMGPRKRGRPPGSKNKSRLGEAQRNGSQPADHDTELSDLRADNRMLRAEMYRLQEDNATLRAKVLRLEDIFEDVGRRDLIRHASGNRGGGGRGGARRRDDERSGADEADSRSDDSRGGSEEYDLRTGTRTQKRIKFSADDPASQFLAFNPFDDLVVRSLKRSDRSDRNGRSHRPQGRERGKSSIDHRRTFQDDDDADELLDDEDDDDDESHRSEHSDKEAAAIQVLAAALQKHQQQRGGKRAEAPSSYRRHNQAPGQQGSASTGAGASKTDALRDLLRAAAAQGINLAH